MKNIATHFLTIVYYLGSHSEVGRGRGLPVPKYVSGVECILSECMLTKSVYNQWE